MDNKNNNEKTTIVKRHVLQTYKFHLLNNCPVDVANKNTIAFFTSEKNHGIMQLQMQLC